ASSNGQCAHATDTWNLATRKVLVEITKILFEFLDGFALGQIVGELLEIAKPHPLVLPMDVTSGVHGISLPQPSGQYDNGVARERETLPCFVDHVHLRRVLTCRELHQRNLEAKSSHARTIRH